MSKQNKKTLYFFIVLISIFIILNYYSGKDKEKIYEEGKYTIAYTIRSRSIENGRDFNYRYSANLKTYNKWSLLTNYNVKTKNGRYFLIYLPEDPEKHIILQDKPVPDSVLKAPLNGWSKEEFEKLFDKEIEN